MSKEKEILEKKIILWVKKFVNSLNYKLIDIIEKSNLSKINNENIKKFSNYNNWDFIPDYAVIVINKEANSKLEIILINRETKAVGLRSIGEIMSYNRLVNPKFSFLITGKGHSNEISYFIINEKIRSRLIKFGRNSLIIFSFDDNSNNVNQESIIPFEYRNIVNG
jgi:23S rRNA pseudoU1915 N3-methylase RlmH